MHTKKHDGFFDEETSETKAEKELITMLGTYDKPVAANLEVGSKVSGKILKVSDKYAFVEIGGKNEAVVEVSELTKEDGTLFRRTPGTFLKGMSCRSERHHAFQEAFFESRAATFVNERHRRRHENQNSR